MQNICPRLPTLKSARTIDNSARPIAPVERSSAELTVWQEEENIAMANILVSIEKGIEIGAEDALKWLVGADKALCAAPEVIASLATLIGAVEKPLADLAGAAQNPLNISLDIQTAKDLKAAWPAVKQFLASFGVKF